MGVLKNEGLRYFWEQILAKIGEKAPKHEAHTTDIGEGSALDTGVLYLVYEEQE